MPVIDVVGRKKFKNVVIYAFIYVLLIVGGITMVYPFLLMLSGSTVSDVDYFEYRVIPKYYYDDEYLYKKYISDKYARQIDLYNEKAAVTYLQFPDIKIPQENPTNTKAIKEDWSEFLKELPMAYKAVTFIRSGSMTGKSERIYRKFVVDRYKNVENINKYYKTEFSDVTQIRAPMERLQDSGFVVKDSVMIKDYNELKKQLSLEYIVPVTMEGNFQLYLARKYNNSTADFNIKNGLEYKSFKEIVLTAREADSANKLEWWSYIRSKMPLRYIAFDKKADEIFVKFLKKKYKNIAKLNSVYFAEFQNSGYKSFNEVKICKDLEDENKEALLGDIQEMLRDKTLDFPASLIQINTSELKWRSFAEKKYKDINSYNAVYNTKFSGFSSVRVPCEINDYINVKENSASLRKYFLTKNYVEVLEYILLHGRAIVNTLFFCTIMILSAITFNPMCAYALSRFNLSYSNKVLLFLLVTMAFPHEVSMIPNFLMLKELNLLNTYWALVLPGLASGYSIFILKGFFDSLPKELYEAAQLDGASELNIFWNITLPLARPILAYLALGAFVSSYGAFMFALLVCQDQSMWTLMVWLFEMQSWAPTYMVMAGLCITSIPTLFVFMFAQRTIMRGIIIPVQH